jgi:hypothetical protein
LSIKAYAHCTTVKDMEAGSNEVLHKLSSIASGHYWYKKSLNEVEKK